MTSRLPPRYGADFSADSLEVSHRLPEGGLHREQVPLVVCEIVDFAEAFCDVTFIELHVTSDDRHRRPRNSAVSLEQEKQLRADEHGKVLREQDVREVRHRFLPN